MQLSVASSTQWIISEPELRTLKDTLYKITQRTAEGTVNSVLSYTFSRASSRYGDASSEQPYQIYDDK